MFNKRLQRLFLKMMTTAITLIVLLLVFVIAGAILVLAEFSPLGWLLAAAVPLLALLITLATRISVERSRMMYVGTIPWYPGPASYPPEPRFIPAPAPQPPPMGYLEATQRIQPFADTRQLEGRAAIQSSMPPRPPSTPELPESPDLPTVRGAAALPTMISYESLFPPFDGDDEDNSAVLKAILRPDTPAEQEAHNALEDTQTHHLPTQPIQPPVIPPSDDAPSNASDKEGAT